MQDFLLQAISFLKSAQNSLTEYLKHKYLHSAKIDCD